MPVEGCNWICAKHQCLIEDTDNPIFIVMAKRLMQEADYIKVASDRPGEILWFYGKPFDTSKHPIAGWSTPGCICHAAECLEDEGYDLIIP